MVVGSRFSNFKGILVEGKIQDSVAKSGGDLGKIHRLELFVTATINECVKQTLHHSIIVAYE